MRWMRWHRISVTGLLLVAPYAIGTVMCVYGALAADSDDKGRVVLLQLPLTPAIELFYQIGLERLLHGVNWTVGYALFVPLTTAFLYALGHLTGRSGRAIWRLCHRRLRGAPATRADGRP